MDLSLTKIYQFTFIKAQNFERKNKTSLKLNLDQRCVHLSHPIPMRLLNQLTCQTRFHSRVPTFTKIQPTVFVASLPLTDSQSNKKN